MKAPDSEPDPRLRFLDALDESSFRKFVLVPLLHSLGYRETIEYHGGTSEKGKDIICWYYDPMERRRYVALVLKKGDIHGAVGKSGNASEVLYQVQQALQEPYRDIYGLTELRIDECIVATTGRIKNTAIESISGSLRATNLDRVIRFMDRHQVADLVTKHMPSLFVHDQLTVFLLHELRAPLSSIASSAAYQLDLLNRGELDEARLRRASDRIAADAEIAQQLAERQYEFRNSVAQVRLERLDLSAELNTAVATFGKVLQRDPAQSISVIPAENLKPAIIDRRIFRQVLFNLLSNAVRHGGSERPIQVLALHIAPHLIVRVRDYGKGVPPDHEELIFQSFTSASPGGTGLGLWISRRLVEAMAGELRLTNHANPTEFSIYLKEPSEEGA